MHKILASALFAFLNLFLIGAARAQLLQLKQLTSPEGILAIRPGIGAECSGCQGLFLNGKQILRDQYISFNGVYPSPGDPQLVSVSTATGGNICCWEDYIIDFSGKPHLLVKGISFKNDIARSAHGVIFTQNAGENELGDRLLGVYQYSWGSGKAILKTKAPQYSLSPLTQKRNPSDVLDDPILRAPLVALLGAKEFAEFRMSTAVSGEGDLKIVSDDIAIGWGCFPHACPFEMGLFFIDNKRKLAWAVEAKDNVESGIKSARIWGVVNKSASLVASEIGRWLSLNSIPNSAVLTVPLPPSVGSLYGSQRVERKDFAVAPDVSGTMKIADTNRPNANAIAPVELFKLLAPSIYVVTANRRNGDELQGSAVAVSVDMLLTNCHVVANSESLILKQNDAKIEASLISADVNADRCILKSSTHLTHTVPVRSYDQLKIGERVYSIGAPAGLELTMSDGLLSGKRLLSGRRLVQTTAPISAGSSGGGLFDEAGNLIGITTFRLRDAENLNFAISAEDYLSR